MAGLIRQRERSIARERRLAESAAQIVAATSREQIYDAALAAVPSLLDQNAVARLCFIDADIVDVVAPEAGSPQGISRWSIDPGALGLLLAAVDSYAAEVRPLTDRQRTSLRLPAEAPDVLVVELPLHGEGRARGLLLACGEGAISPSARSGLLALATQVSLALESNTLTEELHRTASEARFRSLVQRAHDLITVLDANGMVIYQSPSIEQALGYTPEEIDRDAASIGCSTR